MQHARRGRAGKRIGKAGPRGEIHDGHAGAIGCRAHRDGRDEEYVVACHMALKPGSYVRLTVTDTGCGMDEQTKARIFEPFFTTKEDQHRTGLGLAIARSILEGHGGTISAASTPGAGAEFVISLPIEPAAVTAAGGIGQLAERT